MTTITLPLNIAKALASMAPFTDKDIDKLALVYVDVTPGVVSALASDRYAIIESIYVERNGEGSLKFGISADGAKFINGLKSKNQREDVTFSIDPASHSLKISSMGLSMIQRYDGENFEQVWTRLSEFANTEASAEKVMPVSLNVALLSRCAKLLDYNGKKVELWSFHTGQASDAVKPSPIHAYNSGAITYHLIQQPTLQRI